MGISVKDRKPYKNQLDLHTFTRVIERQIWVGRRISELEDRTLEITEFEEEQQQKRPKKSEQSLKDLWVIAKWTNIHFVGIWEGGVGRMFFFGGGRMF